MKTIVDPKLKEPALTFIAAFYNAAKTGQSLPINKLFDLLPFGGALPPQIAQAIPDRPLIEISASTAEFINRGTKSFEVPIKYKNETWTLEVPKRIGGEFDSSSNHCILDFKSGSENAFGVNEDYISISLAKLEGISVTQDQIYIDISFGTTADVQILFK